MPLSEREQKILQEIERDLFREDPTFAREVGRSSSGGDEARRVRLGILVFLAGLITLFVFFAYSTLLLGIVAFGAMVAGVVLVATALHGLVSRRQQQQHQPRERLSAVMRRLEERMRQRYHRR